MLLKESILNFRPPRIATSLTIVAMLAWWLIPVQILPSLPLVAMVTGIIGFTTMMVAWWQFKQAGTAICPNEPSKVMVTQGIYAYCRNPMYLGMGLMLAGVALFSGSLHLYMSCGVYFIIINLVFCPHEEQKLENAFGEHYLDYRHKVRRWL